jgi:hypothetical protein
MKRILCLSILVATCAWADDAPDRDAIERVIAAVNNHSKPLTDVFTADAPESERSMLSANEEPWPEVTSPRITTRSIRLIAPRFAVVECARTQFGSVLVVQRTSMLLVMKKDGEQWRIASVSARQDPSIAAGTSPDH